MLAGDFQEARQAGAGSDEHGVEAFVLHQFVDGDCLAHHDVGLEDHPATLQHVNFVADDLLRQAKLWNAIDQNAAQLMESFKNMHLVTHLDEIAGASQTRRAAANKADLLAGSGRGYRRSELSRFALPVGDKPLQVGNSNRFALLTQHAT